MKLISTLLIAFLIFGCSKPGYSVRIFIGGDAGATEDDIKILTNYLKNKSYEVVMVKEQNPWKILSYKIMLHGEKYDHLHHKYVGLVVEYFYNAKMIRGQKGLEKINIRVGNDREGLDSVLKEEINNTADQIIIQLSKRFNESAISTRRIKTSPP